MKKLLLMRITWALPLCLLALACSKEYSNDNLVGLEGTSTLFINFKPVVDTQQLSFGTLYSNIWGESFTVSTFKFYVCKFDLINTDSNLVCHIEPDQYFLFDANDTSTWSIKLSATPFRYNQISFLIGVDSLRNVSGAQTGALDPGKSMFWTWNSGYIMAKLEGNSPLSKEVNNKVEYHIGGFKGTESVLRKPTLPCPLQQYSQIEIGKKTVITITANVNAWFYNPNNLKIADHPVCTTPGQLAKDISENYSRMYTVTAITHN